MQVFSLLVVGIISLTFFSATALADSPAITLTRVYATDSADTEKTCVAPRSTIKITTAFKENSGGSQEVKLFWKAWDGSKRPITVEEKRMFVGGNSSNAIFSSPITLPSVGGTYELQGAVSWGPYSVYHALKNISLDVKDDCGGALSSGPEDNVYPIKGLPQILSPKKGEEVTLPTKFTWTDSGNPLWYQVYIEEAPPGQGPGAEGTRQVTEFTKQRYAGTTLEIPAGKLSSNRAYRLYVWSYKPGGFSKYAATVDFTIQQSAQPITVIPAASDRLGRLTGVGLLQPTDKAERISRQAVLGWKMSYEHETTVGNTGSTRLDRLHRAALYFSDDREKVERRTVKPIELHSTLLQDSYDVSAFIESDWQTYYWRVDVRDDAHDPARPIEVESQIWSFTTRPDRPGVYLRKALDTLWGYDAAPVMEHSFKNDVSYLVPKNEYESGGTFDNGVIGRFDLLIANTAQTACTIAVSDDSGRPGVLFGSQTTTGNDLPQIIWEKSLSFTLPAGSLESPTERRIFGKLLPIAEDEIDDFIELPLKFSCREQPAHTLTTSLFFHVVSFKDFRQVVSERRAADPKGFALSLLLPVNELDEVRLDSSFTVRNAMNYGIIIISIVPAEKVFALVGGLSGRIGKLARRVKLPVPALIGDDLLKSPSAEIGRRLLNAKVPVLLKRKMKDGIKFVSEIRAALKDISEMEKKALSWKALEQKHEVLRLLFEEFRPDWKDFTQERLKVYVVKTLTRFTRDTVSSSEPRPSLTGSWSATFSGMYGPSWHYRTFSHTFPMRLEQNGTKLTGTIPPDGWRGTGTLSGAVEGENVQWTIVWNAGTREEFSGSRTADGGISGRGGGAGGIVRWEGTTTLKR